MPNFDIPTVLDLPIFHVYFLKRIGTVPHLTRTFAAWKVLAARNVKSTGRFGFVGKNPTFTGAVVPAVNAGINTVAFVGVPTTVSDCKPVPALT